MSQTYPTCSTQSRLKGVRKQSEISQPSQEPTLDKQPLTNSLYIKLQRSLDLISEWCEDITEKLDAVLEPIEDLEEPLSAEVEVLSDHESV